MIEQKEESVNLALNPLWQNRIPEYYLDTKKNRLTKDVLQDILSDEKRKRAEEYKGINVRLEKKTHDYKICLV